jgi:hypothetical protein
MAFELTLDVLHGSVEARRADVAALEFVVSEKLDVRPPGPAFRGQIGGLRGGARDRG